MSMGNRRRTFLLTVITASAFAAAAVAQGQQDSHPTITASPLNPSEPIALDGILDEAVWERAKPAMDFIQQDPDFGKPATEHTEVRVAFDRERLYMGVICYDSEPNKLLGFQRRRDEFLPADDRFMWVLDTFLDARSGYYFELNPSGLMGDSLIGSSGQNNRQWDGIWTAKVRRSEIGWVAEIEIPFRTLNFDPNAPAWGINFQRTVRRKSEESLWTGIPRNQGLRRLANAGRLVGIRDVSQGMGLDIKPYALGTAFSAPARGQDHMVRQGDLGVDVFYSPTPSLRANFTLNTDFAQTEVDDRQVNLTRFSLFFDEKRDFFLEGASFFDFRSTAAFESDIRVYPFFSRRIGLSENREPQKILFGTKLTGQVGQQDIGLLHVRTGEDRGLPGEDFTVARVKRRIFSQSFVGGILTRRAPRADGEALYTMGLDSLLSTRRFLGAKNLEFSGFLLGTSAGVDRSGDNLSYGIELNFPNDPWESTFAFREVQQNFDPAVGFVTRRGGSDSPRVYRRYNPELTYSPRPRNHPWIRQFSFGADLEFQTDLKNRLLSRNFEFKVFHIQAHSGDNFTVTVTPTYERLEEDFEIHNGVLLPAGNEYRFTRYSFSAQTANRRIVAVQPSVEFGNFFSGTRLDYSLDLTFRARPGVIIYTEAEWNRISLPEGKFQTRVFRLSPELQFSPWIALVNSIQYDNVSRVLGWQSRFRWILKPGDDFYFVYTHNWRDDPVLGMETLERRAATKVIYTHRF
ncbi:MAG: carbohydrate binding family 9 domain-containing protein [Acidobacteria bacterium]|nr:carbohydrate binding family 9 domain-containing protein [Acidobacteriota bacterium]